MTEHEYDFLVNYWEAPKVGAAYNAVAEYCQESGWYNGFTPAGEPSITSSGMKAIRKYELSQEFRDHDHSLGYYNGLGKALDLIANIRGDDDVTEDQYFILAVLREQILSLQIKTGIEEKSS